MAKPEPNQSAREKAKAARLAAEAAHKRRENTVKIVGAGVVVIIVAAIIVGATVFSNRKPSATEVDPSAALPPGVNSSTYAYQVTKDPAANVPTVQIWEDFQCPACKQFEGSLMPTVEAAATAGTINLQLRPTTFLDEHFPESKDTSARATSAWGCAIDAGKALEYHTAVFAAQPAQEGAGTTQDQLIQIGQTAGITGGALDKFKSCVNASTYLGWAANSASEFEKAGVKGTPAIYVNGKELSLTGINTPDQLMAKIKSMGA